MSTKRKSTQIDKNKNKKKILTLETSPLVNSIKDLIEIGKTLTFYKNAIDVSIYHI